MQREKNSVRQTAAAMVMALSSLIGIQSVDAQTPATGPGQAYPAKPIRIVVPFAPGGPNDILARTVGQKMSETWGQQVIVDNRPGGGTVIGTQFVAKAPADGYTMLMVATSMAVNPSLRSKLPYDTMNDFMPGRCSSFRPTSWLRILRSR